MAEYNKTRNDFGWGNPTSYAQHTFADTPPQNIDRLESTIPKEEPKTSTKKESSAPNEGFSSDSYPPILNVNEAAAMLGFKPSYLYRLNSKGKIPSLSITKGTALRFSKDTLERWAYMGHPKDKKAIFDLHIQQQQDILAKTRKR